MVNKKYTIVCIFIVGWLLNCSTLLLAIELKKVESIKLQVPEGFSIGNTGILSENRFVLLDAKLGRVLLFNGSGQLIATIGRQGVGPGEMLSPLKIEKKGNQVVIADLFRQGVHFFTWDDDALEVPHFFKVSAHPLDVCFSGDWIVTIGYWSDGSKTWWGRKMKLVGGKEKFQSFLPSYVVFGEEEGAKDTQEKIERRAALSASSLCTSYGNRFYTCWGGHMRIILLDGDKKDATFFGHSGKYYTKPVPSVRLMKAYRQREEKALAQELLGLCQIRSIAATSNAFYLIFTRVGKAVGQKDTILQKYTPDGVFLDEMSLSDSFLKENVEDMQLNLQTLTVNQEEIVYLTEYLEFTDNRSERYIHRVMIK